MSGAVVIVGATSGIGLALAHRLAATGRSLVLAARDEEELTLIADDIRLRHQVAVHATIFDIRDTGKHEAFLSSCMAACPEGLHGIILCHGYLGRQRTAESDAAMTRAVLETLFERLPNLRLDPEAEDVHITGMIFRAPLALPVRFDPATA